MPCSSCLCEDSQKKRGRCRPSPIHWTLSAYRKVKETGDEFTTALGTNPAVVF